MRQAFVVLVIIPLQQLAVYGLLTMAISGEVLCAKGGVLTTEVTESREVLGDDRELFHAGILEFGVMECWNNGVD